MATTLSWLQNREHAHIAITAQFDGWTTAWTTTDDTAGMLTAYAATDVAAVKAGVDLIGEIGQSIAMFQPKVDAETITLRILEDEAGTLTGAMLRLASSADYKTYLASDLLPADTTVSTGGEVAFPASGSIYVGHERIDYSTHTTDASGNTVEFSTLTKGVGSLFTTHDGTAFSGPHLLQTNVVPGHTSSPPVTSQPRTWYNRPVALYLHHYEGGAWSTVANSRLLFVGRIKKWKDEGNGWISIELRSIKERLHDLVMADQWSAEIAEGWYVRPSEADVVVEGRYAGTTLFGPTTASFTSSDAVMTWEEIVNQTQLALDTIATAALSTRLLTEYDSSGIAKRIKLELRRVDGSNFLPDEGWSIGLNPYVWWMLGFGDEPPAYDYMSTNGPVAMKALHYSSSAFTLKADHAPIKYAVMEAGSVWTGEEFGAKVNVSNATGTWGNQDAGTLPATAGSAAEGAVEIAGVVMGAKYDTSTITLYRRIAPTGPDTATAPIKRGVSIREDEYEGGAIRVKQVWWETGAAGTLLARLALSTGSAAYNHTTHDVYAKGFGLALPCSIIDVTSFEAIDQDAPEYDLVIREPIRYSSLLETICGVTNRYPIWFNGKIALRRPPTENGYADNAAYNLTEDNKARPDDRVRVEHAPEGIINKAVLEYDWDFATDKPQKTTTIILGASLSDYGPGTARDDRLTAGEAAVHEVSHAVAAVLLGLDVERVQLAADDGDLGVERGEYVLGRVVLANHRDLWRAAVDAAKVGRLDLPLALFGLAGPVGQAMITGCPRSSDPADCDRTLPLLVGLAIATDPAAAERLGCALESALAAHVEEILTPHKGTILELARRLVECRTLTGAEVRAAVGPVRPACIAKAGAAWATSSRAPARPTGRPLLRR